MVNQAKTEKMLQKKVFFDDIEQLRGFACILILIQHLVWICPYRFLINLIPSWLRIGSGAVHVFFAISGFVITYSLADKLDKLNGSFTDNLSSAQNWLCNFYKKRFFRIFPVVFVVTILCGVFLQLTESKDSWQPALLRSLFEIPFGTFNNSVDFFVTQNPIYFAGMGPFWTLAVESQFYMMWPLVLLFCKNNNQRMVVSLFLGLLFAMVVTPLSNMYLQNNYYWTSNNISELFLGSFFAFLYRKGFSFEISDCGAKFVTVFCAFAIWFYPSVITTLPKLFYGNVIETFASVFLVAFCAFCKGSFNFPILGRLFGYLGKRSFSFYAIQLVVANVVVWFSKSIFFPQQKSINDDFYIFLIYTVILLLASELLYRFVERPFRKVD